MRLIATGESFRRGDEPPIGLGDLVRLNSGGPPMMVVDLDGKNVTAAWRSGQKIEERTFPEVCVHRISDLW